MATFANWYFDIGWILTCALGFAVTWVYGLRIGYLVIIPIVLMAIIGRNIA